MPITLCMLYDTATHRRGDISVNIDRSGSLSNLAECGRYLGNDIDSWYLTICEISRTRLHSTRLHFSSDTSAYVPWYDGFI